jgi:protein ImuA
LTLWRAFGIYREHNKNDLAGVSGMAKHAVAQDTVLALRREIARIEGRLAETLAEPADTTVLARCGAASIKSNLLVTGAESFDAALGGGLPKAALTEIHAAETRNAGICSGFAVALTALLLRQGPTRPMLWIGTTDIFREAGFPYAPGLAKAFGILPEMLLFAEAQKLLDALWIAEEAARLTALSATVLELRGNPEQLDLTATQRLHRRAVDSGRPLFLLRQGAKAEPTAAPLRLVLSPAPAAKRKTMAGPLPQSIGPPAFSVSIDKSSTARPGHFILEWNRHDLAFQERESAHPRRLVPLSADGTDLAPASRTVVAFTDAAASPAAGRQPPRKQHATDRRAR